MLMELTMMDNGTVVKDMVMERSPKEMEPFIKENS